MTDPASSKDVPILSPLESIQWFMGPFCLLMCMFLSLYLPAKSQFNTETGPVFLLFFFCYGSITQNTKMYAGNLLHDKRVMSGKNVSSLFEPTCAYCTVGSYASLSVCPSVCPSVRLSVTLDNNSYLKKYYRQESETLPQYKAFICASRKNTKYTLRNIFLVNK